MAYDETSTGLPSRPQAPFAKSAPAMERIRVIAYATVLRACGFGSLAIFCVMVGLSFNARAAFQAGGFLTVIMTLILIYKAWEAPNRSHRRTELWLYLPKEHRPPEDFAQWTVATVMRETYLTFARWTSLIAIAMWSIALLFAFVSH
ncbi:MAG: hypothetical protein IT536_06540 [Hyphomicrobiales bacterium]|nr:hypothetical protein [Hyphomicrobiales bacterium]